MADVTLTVLGPVAALSLSCCLQIHGDFLFNHGSNITVNNHHFQFSLVVEDWIYRRSSKIIHRKIFTNKGINFIYKIIFRKRKTQTKLPTSTKKMRGCLNSIPIKMVKNFCQLMILLMIIVFFCTKINSKFNCVNTKEFT